MNKQTKTITLTILLILWLVIIFISPNKITTTPYINFIEYFFTALLTFNLLKTQKIKKKKYLITIIICTILALLNEYPKIHIQSFLIDLLGSITYLIIVIQTTKKERRRTLSKYKNKFF